jgi:predicted phage-related endonuclease
MTNEKLHELVIQYKQYKALVDEAQEMVDTIADELKAILTAQDTEEMTVDVFKVRYKSVTSTRLDTTTLKKELPEIAERYSKQTTSKRFSVA